MQTSELELTKAPHAIYWKIHDCLVVAPDYVRKYVCLNSDKLILIVSVHLMFCLGADHGPWFVYLGFSLYLPI